MRFFVRVPLWPAVLVFFCLITGICVFVGRYPWVSVGALALIVFLAVRLIGHPERLYPQRPTKR